MAENDEQDSESIELFAYYGIALALLSPVSLREKIQKFLEARPAHMRIVALALERDEDPVSRRAQIILPLADETARVVPFVPRHALIYLEYGVFDTFRDVRALRRAALNLESRGILLVGQLVQMHVAELAAFVDEAVIAAMRERLITVGLDFGMRLPTWRRMQEFVTA